ncbi:ABC transporter substrate-binding protein [Rhodococcus rhodnii]|nr:ABC transporter substrate-binding protein [Rhodococcus rhodnii]
MSAVLPVPFSRVLVGLACAAALVVTGCSQSATAAGPTLAPDAEIPTEIPAGTTLVVADQSEAQQYSLRASGELDALPFDVEFANFTGGPEVLESFRAGATDVGIVGDVPPIHAAASGQDVPIVAAFQKSKHTYSLATAPGADVRTPDDLRGKRIAYAEGTAQQVVVLRSLGLAGLGPSDVELVRLRLGEFSDALVAGQVDVAPLAEPRLTRYLDDTAAAGGSAIHDLDGISEGLSYLYAPRRTVEDAHTAAALRE